MKDFENIKWEDLKKITSKNFICWNCGKEIASEFGYSAQYKPIGGAAYAKNLIYICHHCKAPILLDKFGDMIIDSTADRGETLLPADDQWLSLRHHHNAGSIRRGR